MQGDPVQASNRSSLFLWEATKGKKTVYLLGTHDGALDSYGELSDLLRKVKRVYFEAKVPSSLGFSCSTTLDHLAVLRELIVTDKLEKERCISQITAVVQGIFGRDTQPHMLSFQVHFCEPPAIVAYKKLNPLLETRTASEPGISTVLEDICADQKKKIRPLLKKKESKHYFLQELIHRIYMFDRLLRDGELVDWVQNYLMFRHEKDKAGKEGDFEKVKRIVDHYQSKDIIDSANTEHKNRLLAGRIDKIRKKNSLIAVDIISFTGEGNLLDLLVERGWTITRL